MPVDFFVYSRNAVERLPPHDVPHVIISITTTADDQASLPPSSLCRGVLRLAFSDVDAKGSTGEPVSGSFSKEHALAIWDFVDEHRKSVARIIVHCDAGVSRSPAVAAAIARYLGEDDREFFQRYRPNAHVYRSLCEAVSGRFPRSKPHV